MYDSILVPVDASDPSDAAIDHARELASDQSATVHVVHVLEYPDRGVLFGRTVPSEMIETLREEAEKLVNRATNRLDAPGVDAEGEVVEGIAAETIPEYAEEEDVDLIVMGTHGRTGVKRALLGSTTERTLRRVDRPVLTVESPP